MGEPGLSFCCPLLLQSKVSTGRRKGRNRDCPHVGHQNVRVVGDAGCERVHKEKKVKILCTLQERRGAWCGEGHQLVFHLMDVLLIFTQARVWTSKSFAIKCGCTKPHCYIIRMFGNSFVPVARLNRVYL